MGHDSDLVDLAAYLSRESRRKRGWQQSGELTVAGGRTVSLNIDFGEEDTYTVGFLQPYAPTPGGDDISVRAEALVMWNVGGTYKPVKVSLVGGMSVTAAARGVKIIMSDATNLGNVFPPAGTEYKVSAQVARGTRGYPAVAPYFVPKGVAEGISVAVGAGAGGVAIPTNAGVQSIFVTVVNSDQSAINPGDALVQMNTRSLLANPAASAHSINQFDPIRVAGSWVPLIAGCTSLAFNNVAQSKTQLWGVFFGVDG